MTIWTLSKMSKKVIIIEKFASSNTPVFRPEIQNETVEE